ncbi:MAG: Riboflavin biosynthesis protein RibF [Verrucomicrobiota bacterium]|jgi:riboflavin kinase/FMN adenylyltransferase
MRVIRTAAELAAGSRKVCLAIGVFDGVHLGHQQIIRQTIADAHQHGGLALVVTFDRHPAAIVAPSHLPPQIYPQPQKLRTIAALGADATLVIEFNQAFSQLTGEAFIRSLARDLGKLQSICVGADFVFGHKRSGDVPLLGKLGAELGFTVHGMAALALDGETVSSTRIRAAIQSGNLDDASQMLGRPYSISGQVLTGDQLGRQLGFPTANLDVTQLVLPPNGVYVAHTTVDGKRHRSVLNIGIRPTVNTGRPERRFEVHLLDFKGDLYGKEMEVEFVTKLRDEMKFASLDALKAQIAADITAAAKCF